MNPNVNPSCLNGFNIIVTANLSAALRQLHSEGKGKKISVDAFCINQADLAEQSCQVVMMGDIYARAKQTFLWLGESGEDSDVAMDFVSTFDQTTFDTFDPDNPSPVWKALRSLLKRGWWKRMWVVQETMLAQDPIVKCGAKEVAFERFVKLKNLQDENEKSNLERFRPIRNVWRECSFTSLLWLNWREWVGVSLSSWLVDVGPFKCQRPRDKLYACLGLVRRESRDEIKVEYDEDVKTDRMVFLEAGVLAFKENGVFALQLGQVEKNASFDLPSWCPDWTADPVIVPFVGFDFSAYPVQSSFPVPAPEKWSSEEKKKERPTFIFSYDREILFIHGFIIGTVDFVDQIPDLPMFRGDNLKEADVVKRSRKKLSKDSYQKWEAHVQTNKPNSYESSAGGYLEALSNSNGKPQMGDTSPSTLPCMPRTRRGWAADSHRNSRSLPKPKRKVSQRPSALRQSRGASNVPSSAPEMDTLGWRHTIRGLVIWSASSFRGRWLISCDSMI